MCELWQRAAKNCACGGPHHEMASEIIRRRNHGSASEKERERGVKEGPRNGCDFLFANPKKITYNDLAAQNWFQVTKTLRISQRQFVSWVFRRLKTPLQVKTATASRNKSLQGPRTGVVKAPPSTPRVPRCHLPGVLPGNFLLRRGVSELEVRGILGRAPLERGRRPRLHRVTGPSRSCPGALGPAGLIRAPERAGVSFHLWWQHSRPESRDTQAFPSRKPLYSCPRGSVGFGPEDLSPERHVA